MKKRWVRVARPTRISRRPVANGSRVPAWPTRARPGSSRRTAATRACEVLPAGLSTRMTPPPAPAGWALAGTRPLPALGPSRPLDRLRLGGYLRAQEADQLVPGHRGGEARRLAMTPAAAGARDPRDVDPLVDGPQGHLAKPALAVPQQVAHQGRDHRALDRAQVIDHALGVVLLGAGLGVVTRPQVAEREAAGVEALDVGERPGQQLQLAVRDALVEPPVDLLHVDAHLDEVRRHGVGAGAGVLVHE